MKKGAKKWIWSSSNKKMTDGGDLDYRAAVQLTGKQKLARDVLHYETKEGFWVDDRHASQPCDLAGVGALRAALLLRL